MNTVETRKYYLQMNNLIARTEARRKAEKEKATATEGHVKSSLSIAETPPHMNTSLNGPVFEA